MYTKTLNSYSWNQFILILFCIFFTRLPTERQQCSRKARSPVREQFIGVSKVDMDDFHGQPGQCNSLLTLWALCIALLQVSPNWASSGTSHCHPVSLLLRPDTESAGKSNLVDPLCILFLHCCFLSFSIWSVSLSDIFYCCLLLECESLFCYLHFFTTFCQCTYSLVFSNTLPKLFLSPGFTFSFVHFRTHPH